MLKDNKIDKWTKNIESLQKFLYAFKNFFIKVVTFIVFCYIAYVNRDLLIDQATKTVIHQEVLEEFEHLHIEPKEFEKMQKDINILYSLNRKNKNNLIEFKEETKLKPILLKIKTDSIRIDETYRRLDILLERLNATD